MKAEKIIQRWDQILRGLIATIDKYADADLYFVPFEGGFSVR